MTGKLRSRPLTEDNSGNFGAISLGDGTYPGVEVKFFSSSMVERSVVNCDVRFSAALTILLMYPPVFFEVLFSGAGGMLDSVPRHFGSRKPKSAFFWGVCLAFQWQLDGKSHRCSQFLRDTAADLRRAVVLFQAPKSSQPI